MKTTRVGRFFHGLARFGQRPWYLPLVAALSALDAYVFVVPNEVLLFPAVLAHRKHWVRATLWVCVGSALGAASFAALTSAWGAPWLQEHFAGLMESSQWEHSQVWISGHGFWGLTLISLSPFPQHAAVALAGLARMQSWAVFLSVLIGRTLKYMIVAWISVRVADRAERGEQ